MAFLRVFRAAFLRGGAAWRERRFWGRFWAEQWRDGVHRGLFGADFFHFLVQKTRSCALGDVFGAGKWVFGPPGGAGLGWAQGGGIVMHSTCLAGCQIFFPLARFYFLPAHALLALALCTPHYYTHAQRSPAARLFARLLACGSLASKPTKQRISLSGSHQKHAQPLTTPRLLPKSSAMQSHGDICSIRIPAKQRRGPSAATPSQPVPTFHPETRYPKQQTSPVSCFPAWILES